MKNLLLIAFLISTTNAFAVISPKVLNYIISTCKDIKGKQVDVVFHPDIEGIAYATLHREMFASNGQVRQGAQWMPVIYIDLNFYKNSTEATQMFALAHECGHQKLGHVASMTGSQPNKEFDADCYATHLLVKAKLLTQRSQLLDVERDFYNFFNNGRPGPRSPSHPGTLERFDHVNECFDHAMRLK